MSHNPNVSHTENLRQDVLNWKKKVGASYDDMADIFGCAKSHLFVFLKQNGNINFELGCRMAFVVMNWQEEHYIQFKTEKTIFKRKSNVNKS